MSYDLFQVGYIKVLRFQQIIFGYMKESQCQISDYALNCFVIRIIDITVTYFDCTEHPYILSDIHMIHLLGDTLRRSHIDKSLYIPHRMYQGRTLQNHIISHHDYLMDIHYTRRISSPIPWYFLTIVSIVWCVSYIPWIMGVTIIAVDCICVKRPESEKGQKTVACSN